MDDQQNDYNLVLPQQVAAAQIAQRLGLILEQRKKRSSVVKRFTGRNINKIPKLPSEYTEQDITRFVNDLSHGSITEQQDKRNIVRYVLDGTPAQKSIRRLRFKKMAQEMDQEIELLIKQIYTLPPDQAVVYMNRKTEQLEQRYGLKIHNKLTRIKRSTLFDIEKQLTQFSPTKKWNTCPYFNQQNFVNCLCAIKAMYLIDKKTAIVPAPSDNIKLIYKRYLKIDVEDFIFFTNKGADIISSNSWLSRIAAAPVVPELLQVKHTLLSIVGKINPTLGIIIFRGTSHSSEWINNLYLFDQQPLFNTARVTNSFFDGGPLIEGPDGNVFTIEDGKIHQGFYNYYTSMNGCWILNEEGKRVGACANTCNDRCVNIPLENISKIDFSLTNPTTKIYQQTSQFSVERQLLDIVGKMTTDGIKEWIICGHSLGAALATIAAFDLQKRGIQIHSVYSYASPRVGNPDFVNSYNSIIKNHFRISNNDDVINQLPPVFIPKSDKCYTHVGEDMYAFTNPNLVESINLNDAKNNTGVNLIDMSTKKAGYDLIKKGIAITASYISAPIRFLIAPIYFIYDTIQDKGPKFAEIHKCESYLITKFKHFNVKEWFCKRTYLCQMQQQQQQQQQQQKQQRQQQQQQQLPQQRKQRKQQRQQPQQRQQQQQLPDLSLLFGQ